MSDTLIAELIRGISIRTFDALSIAVWKFRLLRKPGIVAGIFLIGYAISRTIVENFREPDNFTQGIMPQWFTMGMLLSIPMILGGAWLIHRALKQPKLAAA